ncbi:hypothetical protein BDF14DRAFT_1761449 [Spinellus fusiger]|nr:hypothetical protein BDF14DRAFT_1761449 [Spinellus fusiger]
MPSITSLSARIFGSDKSHTHTHTTLSTPPCCSCGCHQSIFTSSPPPSPFTPSRWFPRIRRRSSSSSSGETRSQHPTYYTLAEQEHLSKLYHEFKEHYTFAEDEMAYATESHGSIYYHGDLLAAQEAVHLCLADYHHLLSLLDKTNSRHIDSQWADLLGLLRHRLEALPIA